MKTIPEEHDVWTDVWFMSRVVAGFLLHVSLCFAALANAAFMVELCDSIISSPRIMVCKVLVGLSAFAAGMAGTFWVKSVYIRWVLPEVMDDALKKLSE